MTIANPNPSYRPRFPRTPVPDGAQQAVPVTATCRYCHRPLPPHVSLAAHYATCAVLDNCLGPKSPFPGHSRYGPARQPR